MRVFVLGAHFIENLTISIARRTLNALNEQENDKKARRNFFRSVLCAMHDDHIIRSGTHRIQRPAVAQSREFRVGLAVIQCMVISRNITFPFLVNANGFLTRIFLV